MFVDSPSKTEIEEAILAPKAPGGLCLYGDLEIYSHNRSLRFYLGAPGRAVIVYKEDVLAADNEWIRNDPDGRNDVFLICPDMAPDEFYKWPHSVFVSCGDAIETACSFLEAGGSGIVLDDRWDRFTYTWIDFEDTPYYPTRSEQGRSESK